MCKPELLEGEFHVHKYHRHWFLKKGHHTIAVLKWHPCGKPVCEALDIALTPEALAFIITSLNQFGAETVLPAELCMAG